MGDVEGARLDLFGTARLSAADGHELALPRRALMLAAYLLVGTGEPKTTRIRAAAFLWPEASGALANLRQLIARSRAAQGETAFLCSDDVHVWLDISRLVSCDLIEFREWLPKLELADAETFLTRFAKDLASNLQQDGDQPARWLAGESTRHRSAIVAAISDLLSADEARANPALSFRVARKLVDFEPLADAGWRTLITGSVASANTALAERILEEYRSALRDYGASPPAETVALLGFRQGVRRVTAAPHRGERSAEVTALVGANFPATGSGLPRPPFMPRLIVLPPAGPALGRTGMLSGLLVEDVIIGLSAVPSLAVVAAHTAWRLQDDGTLARETFDQLNVGYVVDFSTCEGFSGPSLVVKLRESAGHRLLWAERLDLSPATSEACYRQICSRIIAALADAVEQGEIGRYEGRESPDAYYWHLIGNRHLRHLDLIETRRAAKAFRRSLALDAEFAPAYAGLARAMQREWLLLGRGDQELLLLAEQSAARAAHLDPRDARGHRELGLCRLYLRRHDESLASYREAERRNQGHADLVADFADALAHAGEPEAGLARMQRAMALNPIPPGQYWWDLAGIQFQLRRYEEALASLGHMTAPAARLRLAAACWAHLGDVRQAQSCAGEFLETYPDFRIEDWLSHVPNRRADDSRHYAAGLKAAGFV